MASLTSLLGVARDGMVAQQGAINVTGENVTNATTPGYVRRSAVLESQSTLQGQPGGVYFAGIARSFDQFAEQRVLDESGKQGAANTRSQALTQAEALVAPEGAASIATKINAMMDAFNELVGYPGELTVRQDVLAKSSDVAATIAATAKGITTQRAELFQQAQGVADELNVQLAKIGTLSGQIAQAQAAGDPAAGLRDQRDVVVSQVADRIGARTLTGSDGNYVLFGGGTALVDGTNASQISVELDTAGALRLQVVRPGGAKTDITTNVVAGSLGGLREARDQDLPQVGRQLDQLAFDLSKSVNTVHSAGFGLDGGSGRPLFTPPTTVAGAAASMAVDASVAGQPDRIAASSTATDVPGGNQNALALLHVGQTAIGASGTPAESIAALTAGVGVKKAAADGEVQLRQSTVAQVKSLRDSASGVSIDEEMVDLTRFQRAFQASVQVMQTADQLMQSLLQMVQTG
jgi:flagellar hook-associated protein 1 FlgK